MKMNTYHKHHQSLICNLINSVLTMKLLDVEMEFLMQIIERNVTQDLKEQVHCQMEETVLTRSLEKIGYRKIFSESNPLPNGKALVRIDFELEN